MLDFIRVIFRIKYFEKLISSVFMVDYDLSKVYMGCHVIFIFRSNKCISLKFSYRSIFMVNSLQVFQVQRIMDKSIPLVAFDFDHTLLGNKTNVKSSSTYGEFIFHNI